VTFTSPTVSSSWILSFCHSPAAGSSASHPSPTGRLSATPANAAACLAGSVAYLALQVTSLAGPGLVPVLFPWQHFLHGWWTVLLPLWQLQLHRPVVCPTRPLALPAAFLFCLVYVGLYDAIILKLSNSTQKKKSIHTVTNKQKI
jgi:hypothetical protein